jgi:hypothetical protein
MIGSLQVEREQVLEHLFIRDVGRSSVGRQDCPIELGVGIFEPRRTLVVEVGERPLL